MEELADELAMHSDRGRADQPRRCAVADCFVVGKVLSVEKHPDAERLSVCEVDAGDGDADDRLRRANVAAGPDGARWRCRGP